VEVEMHVLEDTPIDRARLVEGLDQVVRERRSVRGFLPTPVPPETLRLIFATAQLAPSNCNVQPWRSYVASGKTRDRVQQLLLERVDAQVPAAYDFTAGKNAFEGDYRRLQVECAVALYSEMGVGRDDRTGRWRAARRNFELFDAPHVVFVGMSKSFGVQVALDVGIYLQTLMLSMTAHGIACCPQGALRNHPSVVREVFDVPDDVGILCGISFGYEDPSVPANRTRVPRSPLEANVTFGD
jgi:nitroreductase